MSHLIELQGLVDVVSQRDCLRYELAETVDGSRALCSGYLLVLRSKGARNRLIIANGHSEKV